MVKGDRWASSALVKMLIDEMKDFKAAAEVVSGSVDIFAMCERDIKDKVEEVERERSVASSLALQQALEGARHEIAMHEAWQSEVISGLAKQDDEEGLTRPLRQAFSKSAKVREALLEQVKKTFDEYFSGSSK